MNRDNREDEVVSQIASKMNSSESDMAVQLEVDEAGIGKVIFDLPGEKINKLSRSIFERLNGILDECRKNKKLKALLITSAKPDIFIAGADINEIAGVTDRDEAERMSGAAQLIFHKLEDLGLPVIAVIHGACLGGGMELALSCDYRIASDDPKTKLGQPEVNLGIIPGAGGTQRMPRLIGLQGALDLILSGRTLDAKKSKKMGLVDRIVPKENLFETAYAMAKDLAAKKYKKRKHSALSELFSNMTSPKKASQGAINYLLEDTPLGRKVIFNKARAQVMKKTGGHYPAPLKAIEAIEASVGGSEKRGYAKEASLFGELAISQTCKNLIQIFYANEAIKKDPGAAGVEPSKIDHVAILGAGLMGGGIAQLFAHYGMRVRMKDINNQALAKGFHAAQQVFQERVKRRRMTEREMQHKMAQITGTTVYTGFKQVDLVVEAVLEDMNLKQKVLKETEEKISDTCIFATNTSSLSVTKLASVAKKPGRVIGMHFFNPVSRMPLVEVIPGENTSPEAIATIVALCKRMGKIPIVVGDGPGFLVNRLLGIYLNEASKLFEEGVDIEAIDLAMLHFGMPMGPFRLLDEIGIQTASKVAKVLFEALGERFAAPDVLGTVLHDGRLGKAAGRGFYLYDDDGKDDGHDVDRSVYDLWPSRKVKSMPEHVLVERMIFPMINEASRCLNEKIAKSSRDIDIAMIMGTGFPPFLGGLVHYANQLGLATIVERLQFYEKTCGERFAPEATLIQLAKEHKTL